MGALLRRPSEASQQVLLLIACTFPEELPLFTAAIAEAAASMWAYWRNGLRCAFRLWLQVRRDMREMGLLARGRQRAVVLEHFEVIGVGIKGVSLSRFECINSRLISWKTCLLDSITRHSRATRPLCGTEMRQASDMSTTWNSCSCCSVYALCISLSSASSAASGEMSEIALPPAPARAVRPTRSR